jgi:gliding motility-associatede transport system auxiliary component
MVKRILNIVGWIGTGLVFVALAVSFVQSFSNYSQYSRPLAIAGLVCVLAYSAGQWQEIAAMFERRQARYGALAGTSIVVVLGILIAVNYIGTRQKRRWDLTASKQFSLSDQSKSVIAKLDSPLQVLVFAQEPEFPRYQDKLKEYQYLSKQVSTEYIDPDKKPAVARQNQITTYGTIILNYKGRTERVTADNEQDITNGIIKVVSGQQRKVYFTQGHGERDIAGSDRNGYGSIVAALGKENYSTDKLVIAQTAAVPDDASVVVVAGPKIDFLPTEIDPLKKYLEKGGKLFLELDPPDKADAPALASLIAIAHDWGIEVGNDVVVDISGRIGDPTVPVAAAYPAHPITDRFTVMTAFPLTRSASPTTEPVNGHSAQSVIQTSPRSWAETDLKGALAGKPVEYDEGKDKKGPVSIASAASAPITAAPASGDKDAPKPEARVVVIGDSDFASNAVLGFQGNRDLFMNIVGWLSQQENLISIRPKEADDRRITMTNTQQQSVIILSLLIIPGFIFGTGVYTWWRRR